MSQNTESKKRYDEGLRELIVTIKVLIEYDEEEEDKGSNQRQSIFDYCQTNFLTFLIF